MGPPLPSEESTLPNELTPLVHKPLDDNIESGHPSVCLSIEGSSKAAARPGKCHVGCSASLENVILTHTINNNMYICSFHHWLSWLDCNCHQLLNRTRHGQSSGRLSALRVDTDNSDSSVCLHPVFLVLPPHGQHNLKGSRKCFVQKRN